MVEPLNLTSSKNIRALLKKLENLKILTFKTEIKIRNIHGNEEEKAFIIPDITERQLASHLVIATNGETYLLEDILSTSENQPPPIDFPSRETGKRISAHEISNDPSLASNLVQNLELARLLCAVDMNPNNLFYKGEWPTCPITREKIIFPASTRFGDIFERRSIITAALILKRHPLNNSDLKKEDIINNKAVQDFIWANFKYRQSINLRQPYETLEDEKKEVLSILSSLKKHYSAPLASTTFFNNHPRLKDSENLRLRKEHLVSRDKNVDLYTAIIPLAIFCFYFSLTSYFRCHESKDELGELGINQDYYTFSLALTFTVFLVKIPLGEILGAPTDKAINLLNTADEMLNELENSSQEIKDKENMVAIINNLEEEINTKSKSQAKQRLFQPTTSANIHRSEKEESSIKKIL